MIAEKNVAERKHMNVGAEKGSRGLLVRGARISLIVVFLGGILHATPIMNQKDGQLQDAKALAGTSEGTARKNAAGKVPARHSDHVTSQLPAASACVFASHCSSPVQVPEPQVLVLLGTGFLSVASVVRRRVIR